MKPLADVPSFGGIDADADELLADCFEDHEAYSAARDHERFLVIGRKGSGKTAIFKKLITLTQDDVFTFGHTFSDYPWDLHDKQAQAGVPEEERYTHSWRYLVLMTVAKILLNSDNSQPWSEESAEQVGKLENFVVDSYGSRDPDVTQLFSPSKRLKINPTFKVAHGALEAGVSLERLPIDYLPLVVQDVNRSIAAAVIKALNPDIHYYVCFDQLDLGFSPKDPRYSQRLIGLLLAARDLFDRAKAAKKHFSVVIFLRDDIYQLLQFEDKNKLTENYMSRIEWDSPRSRHTLKQLMERRFTVLLDGEGPVPWDDVFDETQEMPSRQNKYQHILDRTFRRPRDIIKFCNEVLVSYKAKGALTPKFDNAAVQAARRPYSDYLLNELEDEIFKHVPRYRNYVELLKSLDSVQFTLDDFVRICEKQQHLLEPHDSAKSILRQLFEFSIVGYLSTGGGGGGSTYVWRYMDTRSQYNETATTFRVHPGLKEVLGLKRFQRGAGAEDD